MIVAYPDNGNPGWLNVVLVLGLIWFVAKLFAADERK